MEAFRTYGSRSQPASLPIPHSLQASHVSVAANISYRESNTSALFALAGGATTNFGLRFTGVLPRMLLALVAGRSRLMAYTSLNYAVPPSRLVDTLEPLTASASLTHCMQSPFAMQNAGMRIEVAPCHEQGIALHLAG